MFTDIETPISQLILNCTEEVTNWQFVLQALVGETGAKKGLLSLRNDHDCKLFLPPDFSISPFNVGFDEDAARSYLTTYASLDVWCDVQIDHHPFNPLIMSDYLPIADLQKTSFWKWLEPQGVDETVVVDLGKAYGGWVALNLYFRTEDNVDLRDVVQTINGHMILMKHAIKTGFSKHQLVSDNAQLKSIAEVTGNLIAIIRDDGGVVFGGQEISDQIAENVENIGKFLSDLEEQYDVRSVCQSDSHLGDSNRYYVVREYSDKLRKELVVARRDLIEPQLTILTVLHNGGTLKDCVPITGMALGSVKYHWAKLQKRFGLGHPREMSGVNLIFV